MKVFISFAKKDHTLVHALAAALVERGITPLIATQRLSPGSRLDEKVRGMIEESHFVVVLNTPIGSRSRWVQQEIGCAKAMDKQVIPLKTRGAKLTAMLDGYEYYQFKASDPSEDFARVASHLREIGESKGLKLPKESEVTADEIHVLHLTNALKCPQCHHVDIHFFLCLLCGDWDCTECGATVPPTARATIRRAGEGSTRRGRGADN